MPIRLVFIDSIEILSFNIILSKWIDNLISKMLYDMRVELTAGGLWLYEFDADSETNCVFFSDNVSQIHYVLLYCTHLYNIK